MLVIIYKVLIEKGADAINENYDNPLDSAIFIENVAIVKLLIENGADVNYKSSEGRTVLGASLDFDNKEMIKLLKDAGATE